MYMYQDLTLGSRNRSLISKTMIVTKERTLMIKIKEHCH